jgi:hypothetical protein
MPFLSAKPLTEDPEGLSRLKSVIASDPGYEARAREAASRDAMPLRNETAPVVREAVACAPVTSAARSLPASPDPLAANVLGLGESAPQAGARVLSPA